MPAKKTSTARNTKTPRSTVRTKKADAPVAITPVSKADDPITMREYGGLEEAFGFFNGRLFDGKLPHVLINLERKANSYGYFAPNRMVYRADAVAEHVIALNPDSFVDHTDEQVCQTLVHEMAHLWQHFFGKPSARGYHNREWAAKMITVGLMPSSTGMPGGKITGQKMSDYILRDGPFKAAFAALAATRWKLNLESAPRPGTIKAPPSKVKFTCAGCGSNMWGKPDSKDICGDCNQWRVAASESDAEITSYDQAAE
jgi:hypothetical protein